MFVSFDRVVLKNKKPIEDIYQLCMYVVHDTISWLIII